MNKAYLEEVFGGCKFQGSKRNRNPMGSSTGPNRYSDFWGRGFRGF